MSAKFTITVPSWLANIILWPLLLCYRLYYGQSARFIYIARFKFAVVDADLYERLRWYNWRLCRSNRTWYAFATAYCGPCRPPKIIWMHRLVYSRSVAQTPTPFDVFRSRSVAQQSLAFGDGFVKTQQNSVGAPPEGLLIDHRNHNGLDNRLTNLRPATPAQNIQNARKQKPKSTSKYKGVDFVKPTGKYRARIAVDGHRLFLGSFNSEIDAAKAYDLAAKQYFEGFACLNFP
ncbi:MAG: HNH endonuclease [Sedimentisphaerales bacterium]|jgi:hypothetical protein